MRILSLIGVVGCTIGVLCLPFVATSLWALEPLHPEDVVGLWVFSAVLFSLSACLCFGRGSWRPRVAALLLPVFGFIGVEFGVRTVVRLGDPSTLREMVKLGRQGYADLMAFRAHPFLLHTGRPAASLQGNAALGNLTPFNDLGFLGPDRPYEKPENTVRVVCLGGSTTARGYPEAMQRMFGEWLEPPMRVEAFNFGLGHYSSVHSVVNFVLNAIDFDPDYVVFHQAWNDSKARHRAIPVRGDYSHAFQAFDYPVPGDRLLIRGSVIYRWARQALLGDTSRAFLGPAVTRATPNKPGKTFSDPSELWVYARNIRTIVDLALARGIVPVLTTQPCSTDPNTPFQHIAAHIEQCNDVMRDVVGRYGDRVLFVDLDRLFTGKNDLFIDVGHMNGLGIARKAEAIGKVIRDHLQGVSAEQAEQR